MPNGSENVRGVSASPVAILNLEVLYVRSALCEEDLCLITQRKLEESR